MNDLIAYAMDFCSFLVQSMDSKELMGIKQVILFGSVARGEASGKSDVDIFIQSSKNMDSKIKKIKASYYESEIYKRYWKLLGIGNDISVLSGSLDEWPDLKISIISDGITLYGKYDSDIKGGESWVIVWWDKIKKEYKRVQISKLLNGWNLKNRHYDGLIKKTEGKKLGPNCIMIPLRNYMEVNHFLKRLKISHKQMHVKSLK